MILTLSWTLLALLALCTAAPANQEAPAVTTAPIYLPYYNKESCTANLECTLHGKTRATCSGYSSFADGYDNGVNEGPTEVTWTSTFSGSQMEWGVLTMAELPHDPDSFTATWATPTGGSEFVSVPMATESDSDNAGASRHIGHKLDEHRTQALGDEDLFQKGRANIEGGMKRDLLGRLYPVV
ncbi:hypothetical protein Neosp_002437 [[Neocosmospora] mangrovei]